jgi:flagellar assembly factor FliW
MTHQLSTKRFGIIRFNDEDIITVVDGMLGFPAYEKYIILQHKKGSQYRWLQSIDNPALAFLVIEPGWVIESYNPEIEDWVAEELKLSSETAILVFCVVSIPKGCPESTTLNLAGPVVINPDTRTGRQVVLSEASWPTRYAFLEGIKAIGDKLSKTESAA